MTAPDHGLNLSRITARKYVLGLLRSLRVAQAPVHFWPVHPQECSKVNPKEGLMARCGFVSASENLVIHQEGQVSAETLKPVWCIQPAFRPSTYTGKVTGKLVKVKKCTVVSTHNIFLPIDHDVHNNIAFVGQHSGFDDKCKEVLEGNEQVVIASIARRVGSLGASALVFELPMRYTNWRWAVTWSKPSWNYTPWKIDDWGTTLSHGSPPSSLLPVFLVMSDTGDKLREVLNKRYDVKLELAFTEAIRFYRDGKLLEVSPAPVLPLSSLIQDHLHTVPIPLEMGDVDGFLNAMRTTKWRLDEDKSYYHLNNIADDTNFWLLIVVAEHIRAQCSSDRLTKLQQSLISTNIFKYRWKTHHLQSCSGSALRRLFDKTLQDALVDGTLAGIKLSFKERWAVMMLCRESQLCECGTLLRRCLGTHADLNTLQAVIRDADEASHTNTQRHNDRRCRIKHTDEDYTSHTRHHTILCCLKL